MGSAEFACPALELLLKSGRDEIVGVVSQPERPSGRRQKMQKCPAGAFASAKSLPLLTPENINTPESVLMSKEIARTVNDAMDQLPEELRNAITLREIEGLGYGDIAAIMNCPIGTVRSRIFRAREAIAEKLRPLLDTRMDRRW